MSWQPQFYVKPFVLSIFFGILADAQAQVSNKATSGDKEERVVWADPDHPEIDYSVTYAAELYSAGASFDGWWGTIRETSGIGSKENAVAINFSAFMNPDDPNAALLMALCSDRGLSFAYFPRQLDADEELSSEQTESSNAKEGRDATPKDATEWLVERSSGANRTVFVTINGGSNISQTWQINKAGNGVFIEGENAMEVMRHLYDANSLTLSLEIGSLNISSAFGISGADPAIKRLVDNCP
ncbi:hypothetical protein [Roseibium aggregatum]|uniref:hypothetical protein n=1 Tax=Roseibium aggregatum TaxID=187304 RepID=UPI001E342607|nr:hypothetical protein [Roseibium aggregatum]UES43660.1 hypothetical protein GFK90_07660 [Roseibium aggregatum]